MSEAERTRDLGTTLFIFGVLDRWVTEESRMARGKVKPLEKTMDRARGKREWVLDPIFQPKNASLREMSAINCLNSQITMNDDRNSNATPDWLLRMYYQQGDGSTPCTKPIKTGYIVT